MAVKHMPTGVVHSGTKGGHTGCGFDTREKPDHWASTPSSTISLWRMPTGT